MVNLNPLKYCFHCKHSEARAKFRMLPGGKVRREVCAECYEKIVVRGKLRKR
jgi:protein-arginine kinase activator protein McsA